MGFAESVGLVELGIAILKTGFHVKKTRGVSNFSMGFRLPEKKVFYKGVIVISILVFPAVMVIVGCSTIAGF